MIKSWSRRKKIIGAFLLGFLIWYAFCLPRPLFDSSRSFVLESYDGQLLGARIAKDGQWRFPDIDSLPYKFQQAIIEFEDERFFRHFGVDVRAIGRAIGQNVRAKKVVSGGSTISMQLIRLSRGNPKRNVWQKLVEAILATRLELAYSKDDILAMYASHAPFGGNVVGLEAASWRYYGKAPSLLSWAEAATLAVLPNSPALIHPGRNRDALLAKRNRLLDRMYLAGRIDKLDCELAKEEELPDRPLPLPNAAPHLLEDLRRKSKRKKDPNLVSRFQSSIDLQIQNRLNELAKQQLHQLQNNDINNLAILVLEIQSGKVLGYVGNAPGTGASNQEWVNIIESKRSTGSILKPLLFARMIEQGELIPQTLISDIPTYINGYKPENFNLQYEGAVTVSRALARSLNVPFVRMLQSYGLEKFHFDLQQMGLNDLQKNPDHYGLTLILGGAEASLWEIVSIYAAMGRTLQHFHTRNGWYNAKEYQEPSVLKTENLPEPVLLQQAPILSAGSIWETFQAMRELERPSLEGDWRNYSSSRQIAWKTGTSYGFRDAWAIGLDGEYLVGVWAGNADGEGRPGLVGVRAAGPILFQAFDLLPTPSWFERPADELIPLTFCQISGYRANKYCPIDSLEMPKPTQNMAVCPYHEIIHLERSSGLRVNSDCASPNDWEAQPWFILPPIEAHYYGPGHPNYTTLPAYKKGCESQDDTPPLQMIYPLEGTKIYVPENLDGSRSATVFKASHQHTDAKIFWHLDDQFLGTTQTFHELELDPDPGQHTITLVDENGFRISKGFEIISTWTK